MTTPNHPLRRRALALLAGGALGAGAVSTALAADGGAAEPTKIVVSEVIRSVFYAPLYEAIEGGHFADHGLEVELVTAGGSDRVTAALLGDSADVGLLGPETAVFIHNQESATDIKVVMQLTQRDGSFLVGREPIEDFTVADLAGTTVLGWRPGSMPQMVMNSLFDEHGIDTVDYVTNVDGAALAGAFTSGRGDFVQVFEPIASTLELNGSGAVVASVGTLAEPFPYTAFAVTDGKAESSPEMIGQFVAAMWSAIEAVQSQPAADTVESLLPYFPDADPATLEAAVQRYLDAETWAAHPTLDPEQFERLLDIMVLGGVLDADDRVPYDAVVINAFAEAAAAA